MSTSRKLKPLHVDGFRFEAWNEEDATIKNNVLAASTAENMAVATGTVVIRLQSDTDLWYNLSTTAVIPTGDASAHSYLAAGESRWLWVSSSVTNISLISAGAAKVCGWLWE